jgi:predicted AlkP superfamily phosphohydrolase/phosphomutase
MPEFQRLAREGSFQPLATANPPQSPVAWSTFVTGLDPGGHGVFDFVHRDPATYTPISSATAPPSGETPPYLELFGWVLPLGGEEPQNTRGGVPFWDLLIEAGVPTQVYRMPANYPVPPSRALTLSGMGTVDMRGEFGKYTWYTDDAFGDASGLKADVEVVTLEDEDLDGRPDTVYTRLKGPPDVFHLLPGQLPGPEDYLSIPVSFHIDPEQDVLWVKAGGAEAVLVEGEFSDWLRVEFEALPWGLLNLSGIVRFYAKEIRPEFRVYASPVNIDPAAPAQTIATPEGAAEELAEAIGPFWTQGFPEEINALKDGLFTDDDYVKQVALVHEEAERMLEAALARFAPGACTFMYLSDIDLQCHMLWRHGDPKTPSAARHPGWEAGVSPRHEQDVEGFYRNIDRLLGKVRAQLPPETLLIVMSDHGFQPMTRQLHLNAWLREHGYLALKQGVEPPAERGPGTRLPHLTTDVDWSRTKAFGVGFNGLYLNLAGREAEGIVDPSEAEALMDELAAALTGWRDPATGLQPVRRVFRSAEVYAPERRAEGPDLVVGYDAGYGCSDDSTLGDITAQVIEDNTRGFTGNHLMDPEVVPGILLVNRRLEVDGHDLTDLTVTILRHFGVDAPEAMHGRSLFEN